MNFSQPEYESCSVCGAIFDIKKELKCPTCGTSFDQEALPTSPKLALKPEKVRVTDDVFYQSFSLVRSKNKRTFEIYSPNKTRLLYSKLTFKFDPFNMIRLLITALRAKGREIPMIELRDNDNQLMGNVYVRTKSGGTSTGSIRNSIGEVVASFSGKWGTNLSSSSNTDHDIDALLLETAFNKYTLKVKRKNTIDTPVSNVYFLDNNDEPVFSVKPITTNEFIIQVSNSNSDLSLLIIGTLSFVITGMFFT
ncbi:MAG: hypothetical protein ACFFFG_07795 [Candidatus Thorarchaeota archaeon]